MKLDASHLRNISHAVSNSGEVCQITLDNQAGDSISFTLSFRQLSHFVSPLREVAKEMRKRLLAHQDEAKAETIAALTEAPPAEAAVFAKDENTGDPIITFEGADFGLSSVRLPPEVAGPC